MFILTEKIAPPSRPQIFNDYDAQDALILRMAEDQRWVKHLIGAFGAKLRNIWH